MSNHRRGQAARTPQLSRSARVRGVQLRTLSRWRSKFARFISGYGVARLAKGLDVRPSAIYHWVRGVTAPGRTHAATIQRLARESRVKLSLDNIYQHSRDVRAREGESVPKTIASAAASRTSPQNVSLL
jgi:hypothetical protein